MNQNYRGVNPIIPNKSTPKLSSKFDPVKSEALDQVSNILIAINLPLVKLLILMFPQQNWVCMTIKMSNCLNNIFYES